MIEKQKLAATAKEKEKKEWQMQLYFGWICRAHLSACTYLDVIVKAVMMIYVKYQTLYWPLKEKEM